MTPYKFVQTDNPKPNTNTTKLLEKAMDGFPLNRKEKNQIAEICYGTFSQQCAQYRLMGWCWDLSSCLPAFLVEFDNGDISKFHTADKTAVRSVIHRRIHKIWG